MKDIHIIFITHATGERTQKNFISGITNEGHKNVIEAAKRFKGKSENINNLKIGKILSSPHARCLETVLVFAKELSGFTPENPDGYPQICHEIRTYDYLCEDAFTFDVLKKIVKENDSESMLICTHNNLYKSLPDVAQKLLKKWIDEQEYFKPRPVVISISFEKGIWNIMYIGVHNGTQWIEEFF